MATVLFSCMPVAKYVKNARKDTTIVPVGFDPAKHVLLFAEMPRLNNPSQRNNAVTGKLEKALKKYCPYKYEIVTTRDIFENVDKYGDTSIFKYAVLNSLNSTWHSTKTIVTRADETGSHTSTVSPAARTTTIDFSFFDRTAKKNYPPSGDATIRIEYTVAAFMEIIKKAQGQ